ncbi:MAG: patatin-like phospholipase family protein [Alphaproteobacteria bacterium]|nr:patatin-like phospholipase family protein [Alphaproteobacteria bacterium]
MQKKIKPVGSDRTEPTASSGGGAGSAFDTIALLLQGGGALGAYQAGVYQALAEAEVHPNWLAGISIGAVNAAIIAGNAPEHRVEKLRMFWEALTAPSPFAPPTDWQGALVRGETARTTLNQVNSAIVAMQGVPGFFEPRIPPPWFQPTGTLEATSYYNTAPLRSTLEKLIDFDRIHDQDMRLSIGAVNVRSGNFVYFDSKRVRITPDHIMASGALPPGFPAVEIEGEYYWDGGIVSNTPLQWAVENCHEHDMLAFQVDLWNARGRFPRNMAEVLTRQKEIQYSSRTRAGTTLLKEQHKVRRAIADLLPMLPDELRETEAAKALDAVVDPHVYSIVHLIYRPKEYEGDSKDYEFSRLSMEEHWRAGHNDATRTLRHKEIFRRPTDLEGVHTYDLTRDDSV